MSSPARRVGVYVRISRDKTGAGLGVERQTGDCQELADRLGWTASAAPYVDNDLSAYSGKPRPAYRALLTDIEARRIDTVLTWHTDRLHRSPVELEEWISVCEPRGVEVHTVKAGPIDLATPSGRMVARALGAVARYESEHRSERVAAKMDQIAREGGFRGGARPFGYAKNGIDLEPTEARLIAEGTRMILAGRSLRSVVKAWNDTGITTTKKGQPWSTITVRDALTRPRNAGLVEHRGHVVGPANWPAVVTEDEWRGVCAVFSDPARRTSPGNQPRWLGSMLYLCSVCGGPMIVGTSGQNRKPSYRCRNNESGGPPHVTRAAHALDDFVGKVIVARLSMPDALDVFSPHHSRVDVQAARADLAGIDEQRTQLAARLGRGEISLTMMDAANGELRARQVALEAALADAATTSPIADIVTADDVAVTWAGLGLDVQRTVLAELMTVTLLPAPRGRRPNGTYFDPDSVQIEWNA